MPAPSRKSSLGLRPLCLPALVEERARSSLAIASKSSTSSLHDDSEAWSRLNSSYMPSKNPYASFPVFHSRSFDVPAITVESPPSSPGSLTWSPRSESAPDSPQPRTPRIGSGIVYFSTKNPAPLRPLSEPPISTINPYLPRTDRLLLTTSSISLATVGSVATSISRYSKESAGPVISTLDDTPNDTTPDCIHPSTSPSTTQSPAEAPPTIHAEPVTETITPHECDDPYDLAVGWVEFPSYGLGRAMGAKGETEEQLSGPSFIPNNSPGRPHRLKSRMKTMLKRISSAMKLKPRTPSSPSIISAPVLLDLPGYNTSVALGLSSPIHVAKFLQASEKTHERMRRKRNLPRPVESLDNDTPPIKYALHPAIVDTSSPDLSEMPSRRRSHFYNPSSLNHYPSFSALSTAMFASSAHINPKDEDFKEANDDSSSESHRTQTVYRMSRQRITESFIHPFPRSPSSGSDSSVLLPSAPPSPLHADIVQTLTTLRTFLPSDAPSARWDSDYHSLDPSSPVITEYTTGSPLPFDPELMPFAARRFNEKSYEPLATSIEAKIIDHPRESAPSIIPSTCVEEELADDSFDNELLQNRASEFADSSTEVASRLTGLGLDLALDLDGSIDPIDQHWRDAGDGDRQSTVEDSLDLLAQSGHIEEDDQIYLK